MNDDATGVQKTDDVVKTDEEWRAILSPTQYQILRCHGTEAPGESPFNREKRHGLFVCAGCRQTLFGSDAKFESGTGWPSFFQPRDRQAVATTVDRAHGMVRTEVHCSRCGGHLGHVFDDGPAPTGQRYCINGAALGFVPDGGE
jgi:peptide-methionine (R)-S-oxide reductase